MTELLKDFEKELQKLRLKVSLEELDEAFYVKDVILKDGYISTFLSKQIARRIIDGFSSWINYVHGLLMPSPSSIIGMTESQALNEEDKEQANKIMDKLMIFSSRFNILVLGKEDKSFIDDAYVYWKNDGKPKLMKISEKMSKKWEERFKSLPEKEDKELRRIYG